MEKRVKQYAVLIIKATYLPYNGYTRCMVGQALDSKYDLAIRVTGDHVEKEGELRIVQRYGKLDNGFPRWRFIDE